MSNFKVSFSNLSVSIPSKAVEMTRYASSKNYQFINTLPPVAAKFVKAFVKANYPSLSFYAKSRKFANGNGLHVTVCNADGSRPTDEVVKAIAQFGARFSYLDVAIALGEDKEVTPMVSDCGLPIEAGVKYLSFDFTAPYGSVEAAISEGVHDGAEAMEAYMTRHEFSATKMTKVNKFFAAK